MADDDIDPPARRDALQTVTLVLVTAMVLAFVGQAIYQLSYTEGQRVKAECYQASFRSLNDSLLVSRDAARQDRAGLRDLVSSLAEPDKTAADRRAALAGFVEASEAAERARTAAPLPMSNCG